MNICFHSSGEKMKSGIGSAHKIHGIDIHKGRWAFQSTCRKDSMGANRHPLMSRSQEFRHPPSIASGHLCSIMWQLAPEDPFGQ